VTINAVLAFFIFPVLFLISYSSLCSFFTPWDEWC